ncbi:mitotic fidelity of chromosome transmission- protein [Microbotryomycetes sp. JL201]|nr:mitotic fidelity of chromosome transmission- protein [Microbotryomycetes sp. JL201]
MASTPGRDRGARQQRYNDIGNEGRITGVKPPKNAPRDSAGNEHPSAYFDNSDEGEDEPVRATNASKSAPRRKNNLGSISAAAASRHAQSPQASGHRRDRPDMYADYGERGRKTGVRVALTQRDEDDFEGVDNFFHTSPSAAATSPGSRSVRRQSTAKKSARKSIARLPSPEDWDANRDFGGDGYDESDMQLDDGTSMTPSAYQRAQAKGNSSARRLTVNGQTINGGHARSEESEEERPVQRSTHKGPPGRRISLGESLLGQTRLSPRAEFDNDDDDDDDGQDDDVEQALTGRPPARVRKSSVSRRRSSGASSRRNSSPRNRVQDDEEAGNIRDDHYDYDDYNNQDEGDVSARLNDIPEEDEEEQDDEAPRARSKGKSRAVTAAKSNRRGDDRSSDAKQRRATSGGAQPVVTKFPRKRPTDDHHDGVRRSSRQRLEPVEYWRNERVVYKRRSSGMGIDQVVRIPKDQTGLPQHNRKRGASAQARRGNSVSRVKSEIPEEEGVDDATDPDGIVWSWEGDAEVSRRIAFTAKMIDPKPTYNNKFAFQKIFTELDYLAGGVLVIPAGAEKPSKPARDNSYVFYCIEGSVSVVVHRTRFAIGPGGTFFVPRGNNYSITATSNRDVKLFFTQGRRVIEETDGTVRQDTLEDSRRVSMSQQAVGQQGEADATSEQEDQDEDEDD